jgi:hypothetical protein
VAAKNGFGIDTGQSLDLGYIGAGDVVRDGRGGGALKRTLMPLGAAGQRARLRLRTCEMCEWPLRFRWPGSYPLDGPIHRGSPDAEEFGDLSLTVGAEVV